MSIPGTPLIRSLQSSLQALSAPQDSTREAAFADFLRVGLPTQRLDTWKYTDLRRLAAREFKIASTPASSADANKLLPIRSSHRIVFVDGIFVAELSAIPNVVGLLTRT